MLRKAAMALATVAALSLPMLPSTASAQRGHGGGFHGGFHGGFGGFHGGWRGGGWGWGGLGLGLGLGLGYPYYYGYPYGYYGYPYGYYGCWRTVRVATPVGPRWRRVWVCG